MVNTRQSSLSSQALHRTLRAVLQFMQSGNVEAARRLYPELLRLELKALRPPGNTEWIAQLAATEYQYGNLDAAIDLLGLAVRVNDRVLAWHTNLGALLVKQRRYAEAAQAYQRALRCDPRSFDACFGASAACWHQGLLSDAEAYLKRALAIRDGDAAAYNNLGFILFGQHKFEEAVGAFQRAMNLDPGSAEYHSNHLFYLHYLKDVSVQQMYDAHIEYARKFEVGAGQVFDNSCDAGRRLRVGYLSADFNAHPIGYFTEAVLRAHRANEVDVFCYSDVGYPDEITERIRALVNWRHAAGMADEALAHLIRQDGIDVLVDLAGHSAHNRLPLFARRAAPVQVSWIGYFDTTGLRNMDYVLADGVAVPADSPQLFSEQVYRLPAGYLCYQPPVYMPAVEPAPALARGYVTFGCFNNLNKVNRDVVAHWAELLARLPTARLVLKSSALSDPLLRETYQGWFGAHGVDPARVELRPASGHEAMLREYGDIDIALDPFPYSGGTTTTEALYMGVPVVTWAGATFASRLSASILTSIGHAEWVAESPADYLERAIALAADQDALALQRQRLRAEILASPLGDAERLVRDLEAAFRAMWQAWCAGARGA